MGCRYDIFPSPKEAIKESESTQYDMIITDYHMPEINGIEMIQQIKNNTNNPNHNTSTILLTADVLTNFQESKDLISGIILKPFKLNDLKSKLSELITHPVCTQNQK